MLVRAFYDKNVPEKDPAAAPPRTEIQMRKAEQVGFWALNPIAYLRFPRSRFHSALVVHTSLRVRAEPCAL